MTKQELKEQLNHLSFKRISAIVAFVVGLISIITFGGDIYRGANELIVTDTELAQSEQRVIKKIDDEAKLTRMLIATELIERRTRLTDSLDDAETLGQIENIKEKIRKLDARIEKLTGKK